MSNNTIYTNKFIIASQALQIGNPVLTNNILKNYDGMTAWTPTAVANITVSNVDNCQYILYDNYVTVNLDATVVPTGAVPTITIGNLPYKSTLMNDINSGIHTYLSIRNTVTTAAVICYATLDDGNNMVITTITGASLSAGVAYRLTGEFTYRIE